MSTSTAALPRVPAARPPAFEVMRNNLSNPENWTYLIPTVGAIAAGAFFIPNFALGLAAGTAMCGVSLIGTTVLKTLGMIDDTDENSSEYARRLHDNPISSTLFVPLLEEGILRGAIQPLATRAILWLVPAAAAAFMGTGLSIAVTVSIVATAIIFGAIHYSNAHENAHIQVVIATVSGIALGLLTAQFGLGAAIAAHIANNTISITKFMLNWTEPAPPETTARV